MYVFSGANRTQKYSKVDLGEFFLASRRVMLNVSETNWRPFFANDFLTND